MNVVVGSGPAGVAAAAALLDRGMAVTMLDAGGELEADIQSRVDVLARKPPEDWSPGERAAVQGRLRYNTEGAPLKLAFGSDYVYRDVDALQPVASERVDAYRSLATGGLSVLWGAAILPYSGRDFDGWPLDAAAMHPHYESALRMTGLAGVDDDPLARLYPLPVEPTSRLDMSSQARTVMERMGRHAADLERDHIHFGRARLAITAGEGAVRSCVHCGMCLYGCPYGLIYSSASTLRTRLAPFERFTYRPGVVVRKLSERGGAVTIEAVSRDASTPTRFEASRVYLAAGVLPSTAILLESLGARSHAVSLAQSDHFLLPTILTHAPGRASRERLHTLAQIFIEILDREVTRHGVHLQMYTYNDYYERMARERLGPLYPLLASAVDRLIDRTVMLKGYLHSNESAGIRAALDAQAASPTLRLSAVPNPVADTVIRNVTKLLGRQRRRLGAFPLRAGLRKGAAGSGVHVGGSFPMRRQPREFESDALGVPVGLTRVHVVDATVFPTVPAAPPTLTIMANAYRIASESQRAAEAPSCSG